MTSPIVERLRYLKSLNEPKNGGPYGGFAAEQCMTAMGEAADLLEAKDAKIDRLSAELARAQEWERQAREVFRTIEPLLGKPAFLADESLIEKEPQG